MANGDNQNANRSDSLKSRARGKRNGTDLKKFRPRLSQELGAWLWPGRAVGTEMSPRAMDKNHKARSLSPLTAENNYFSPRSKRRKVMLCADI